MTAHLDVFLCGSASGSPLPESPGETVRMLDGSVTPWSSTSAGVLNRFMAQATGEFVTFVDAEAAFDSARLENAVSVLAKRPDAAAGLAAVDDTSDVLLQPWRCFSPLVAGLMRSPPRRCAVLFRRSEFERTGHFADVPHAIWDWLIRAARAQQPIVVPEADAPSAPALSQAATTDELPVLVPEAPGTDSAWLHAHLNQVHCEELVPNVRSRPDAVAVKAGLWQLHDYLDESHELSQSIEGEGVYRSGDYWHGIMHRREPDYSNAKYWFRRVGEHPVFAPLSSAAAEILSSSGTPEAAAWQQRLHSSHGWDPFAFVELCRDCRSTTNEALAEAAERIQLVEMLLLLNQSYDDAQG